MQQEPLLKDEEEKIVFNNSTSKKNKILTILAILEIIPLIVLLGIAIFYTIRGVNCTLDFKSFKKCDFFQGILITLIIYFPFTISFLAMFISGIIYLVKSYKK